ncbi:DUF305 domain-containing protein [Paraburkholderia sp. CNPSo 3076]|uniref:DUF305 domain-containing protein n=1 Tax=Paraburkholderia sp. CNPSo 3076 TaxID=2940936 RepID=UPI00224EF96B|nr:DUF305 domain-containing protein [Paraburkholderia sp. CNPSo 3076]MCX5542678.1 DUF305 domain-containing protein [Paraburkholderia sp. CNPSo 3076]
MNAAVRLVLRATVSGAAVLSLAGLCAASSSDAGASRDSEEASFLSENDAAMTKMMTGMAARPTGDVDRDFVATMIPHHQGAVDMAMAELRHGHNEQLRRIAQEIVVEQQQEIVAMRLAVHDPNTAPTPMSH